MLRRVQDHGIAAVSTPTPAPSSSNKRKATTKKLSYAHARTGDMSLQTLRGDYVGQEFAVLKQRGQEGAQGDDDHEDMDSASSTKQVSFTVAIIFVDLPPHFTPLPIGSKQEASSPVALGHLFPSPSRPPASETGSGATEWS